MSNIIIVGAGAAGLAAAAELRRAGAEFTILEARSRIGGRVWTLQHAAAGTPIELGAEFVHGGAKSTESLARAAGSLICDVAGDQFSARDGRLTRVRSFWDDVGRVLRRLEPERETDRSVGEFLRSRPGGRRLARARTFAKSFVQGFHAADLDVISERSLAAGGIPGMDPSAARHGRLVTGYGTLLEHHARQSADRIRFDSVVTRIDWERGRARVTTNGGEVLDARAVIVTVPLPLLQSRTLVIEPEPPALRRALDGLAMGSVVRVSLVFRERFWEKPDAVTGAREPLLRLGFLHTPHAPFNIWWTAHPLRAPVIVGWSGGPPALRLSASGDVENAAIATLGRALGISRRRMDRLLEATFHHDWNADPYSRGAYSYAAVGGDDAARRLARPLGGTLFIAGEATADADSGTVEGALESGEQAGKAVLQRRVMGGG
jgi:monoamine oxidase